MPKLWAPSHREEDDRPRMTSLSASDHKPSARRPADMRVGRAKSTDRMAGSPAGAGDVADGFGPGWTPTCRYGQTANQRSCRCQPNKPENAKNRDHDRHASISAAGRISLAVLDWFLSPEVWAPRGATLCSCFGVRWIRRGSPQGIRTLGCLAGGKGVSKVAPRDRHPVSLWISQPFQTFADCVSGLMAWQMTGCGRVPRPHQRSSMHSHCICIARRFAGDLQAKRSAGYLGFISLWFNVL